jgi:4-phospho-D-threonate 3-dehydrogenase / 4-phospho-D-erythronate 3-dehydrogenase
MGDPAGIGPEVVLKAASVIAQRPNPPMIMVLGDLDALRAAATRLNDNTLMLQEWDRGMRARRGNHALPIMKVGKLPAHAMVPGTPTVEGADAAYRYVIEGARMTMRGEANALVTAPINKEWLNRAGHHFPGHSELLASLAHVQTWRMMFAGETLRVALVTVHMGLAEVPRALTRKAVLGTITLLQQHLYSQLGIARPRILVLGFNPHAGENGLFGDEEARVIAPAIRQAQRKGIDVHGPVPPDTAFIRANRDQSFGFDGAVAMYHDQGLIPVKTLEFDRAVNITLGLPFIRTSPDHGTAYDIAGRGIANAASMVAAIEYAAKSARGAAKSAAGKTPRPTGRFLRITPARKGSGRSDVSRNHDRYFAET